MLVNTGPDSKSYQPWSLSVGGVQWTAGWRGPIERKLVTRTIWPHLNQRYTSLPLQNAILTNNIFLYLLWFPIWTNATPHFHCELLSLPTIHLTFTPIIQPNIHPLNNNNSLAYLSLVSLINATRYILYFLLFSLILFILEMCTDLPKCLIYFCMLSTILRWSGVINK